MVRDHEMIAFKQLGPVNKESNYSFQMQAMIVTVYIVGSALVITYTS